MGDRTPHWAYAKHIDTLHALLTNTYTIYPHSTQLILINIIISTELSQYISVLLSNVMQCLAVLLLFLLVRQESPGKVSSSLSRLAVDTCAWNLAVYRSSSTMLTWTRFSYRLLIRSAATRFVHHLLAATGRRLWSFVPVPCPHRVVSLNRCRLIPVWLPSREFNGWILFITYRSRPMLHGVVLTRCSELSSVAGNPHVPSFTAPLWSVSGHSLGNVFDVVPASPSSVETAPSRFCGRGFCFDAWKDCKTSPSPSGRGTVVSIVFCRCTFCCLDTSHWKITRHYSRYCTVAFCYMCTSMNMCPGHTTIGK